MHMAVSQLPDHPGIKRACNHMAVLNLLPDSLHMIHNPAYLCGAEISVRHQSRPLPDEISIFLRQLVCHLRGSSVLPDNGIVHRNACVAVPEHHRLPLVVKPHAGQIRHLDPRLLGRHGYGLQNAVPDFHRIVLYPSRFRIILGMLLISSGNLIPLGIKNKRCRTCCPLIQT